MKSNNWHPKNIEAYIKQYYSNLESRATVRVYLKAYFTTMNKVPETYIKETSEKDILVDLWKYAELIEDRARKTQAIMLSIIKKYITRNDVIIKESKWEEILIRNNLKKHVRAIAQKKTPTQTDLKKILSYADIKGKSLFTFCAVTGLRIDEALALTFDHLDMDKRMVDLRDDIAKDDNQRFTFFTPEAQEFLELWKPEREKALQRMYKKSEYLREKLKKSGYEFKRVKQTGHKKGEFYYWKAYKDGKELTKEQLIQLDNRIWPFDYINAQRMWSSLLDKAGKPYTLLDKNDKFKKNKKGDVIGLHAYNIHSLRRYFFVQLSTDRANDEYVNFMGGHTSELNQAYKNYYENEIYKQKMKEEYEQHLGALSIFESVPDLSSINESLKEKDQQITKLQKQVDELDEFKKKYLENLILKHERELNGK